jgi:hypothetical protein
MFNNRIVIAQVELLRQIFLAKEKDYAGYAELISKYDGPFKALASWLIARDFDQAQTDDIIGHLIPYIKKGRLKTNEINVSPSAVKIKNSEAYTDLIPFVDFIHGTYPTALARTKETNEATERTPVLIGEGIKIYEVNNPNDSRELASDTPWCIAYPGQNNMWTSYRSGGASSFFIVYDDNPPTSNQRKVAIDFNVGGVELTDILNFTGKKLSNGMDWDKYSEYLESKGIDLGAKRSNLETGEEEKILQNKPLSDEEKFFLQYYNIYKSSGQVTVEQIKQWARGIVEFKDAGPAEDNAYYQTEEFFIEDSKKLGEEKSLKLLIRKVNKYGDASQVISLPLKREQIASLRYKNSGAKYALEDTATTSQEIFDGKPGNLNSLQFGGYENTEPLAEVKLKINDSKNYLTKFVGLGYLLPDEVFDYVMDLPDGKDLLIQYVDTGITIPEEQIEKIKAIPALFKTYARKQLISISRNAIQDASILKHLDPNDEKTRNTVLETLIPKDIKNVYSTNVESIINNLNNVPEKWLSIPQIGILFQSSYGGYSGPQSDYKDPLAIKVSLAIGIASYLQDYPTLENALIYLHDTDAINSFKDEAIAQKYLPAIFEPFFSQSEYKIRWRNILKFTPEIIKDPKLNKFRAFGEAENNRIGIILNTNNEEPELIYERVAINILCGNQFDLNLYKADTNFWMYLINNYQKLLDTVFKNVGYENTDTTYYDENDNEVNIDEVDTTKMDIREETKTEYNKERQKVRFEDRLAKSIPLKVLEKPEILDALKSIFSQERLNKLVSNSSKYSEYLAEYLTESINSFSDLNYSDNRFIFEKDNPIIRKITQNGFNVDDYLEKFSYLAFHQIRQLDKWNPGLVESISDSDFLKILKTQSGYHNEEFSYLIEKRPYVIEEMFKVPSLASKFTYEQRQYIHKNLLPRLQQPEQIEEPKVEPEKMPEEPTTASIKIILKIANKLDNKKEYKLADKFTNILRKYNV